MTQTDEELSNSDFSHHELSIELVNPNELTIDKVNERSLNTGPRTDSGDLEKSILENGVENPPQVRPTEDGKGYRVFAGQRRVLAAQAVGLSEIPVIVKDLDDMEALAASVNENNEHLKKEVTRKDRAVAVDQLKESWGIDRVADEFGVEPQTVRNWLEPTRNFWSGTIFDPVIDSSLETEYLADDLLAELRRVMGDADFAERAAKIIIKNKIPKVVVRSSISQADNPKAFLDELKEQWRAQSEGMEQIRPRITLTGSDAERLKRYAKDRGITNQRATKQLVKKQLEDEFS